MSTTNISPQAWCAGGASAFQTSFSDPGVSAAGIVGWALNYVYPLNAWLDQLVGDEAAVGRLAHEWDTASRELTLVNRELSQALRTVDDMQGKSIRALKRSIGTLQDTAADAAEWTEAAAASIALASRIVSALHDAVAGALSELAGIIASLFDVGLSLLDPFDKWRKLSALTRHVDAFIDVIEKLLQDMFDAFDELMRLINALQPLIDEAIAKLRELLSQIVDGAGLPIGMLLGGGLGSLVGFMALGPVGLLAGSVIGTVGGAVLGDTAGGVLSDWLAKDPAVDEIDYEDLRGSDEQQLAYDNAMKSTDLDSLAEFVVQNGYTDTMGQSDRTVVDIKKVMGSDGKEHWVVSLPSTQEWNILKGVMGDSWADILKDYPATNDLDTNVALMLADHPQIATQYQRGVYEAMKQAGVPPGAPVVYTGFSQGGIMSGVLAADRTSPYKPIGIVTTGAPVDRFDIPSHVKVIAFAHESDPVAKIDEYMDSAGRAIQTGSGVAGNPVGILAGGTLTKPSGADLTMIVDNPTALPDGTTPSIHSAAGYTQSVGEWEAENPTAARAALDLVGGKVLDHQTYAFTE